MLKAVFFDLYGTLAGFCPSRYEIQSKACAQFGITVTPDGVLYGYAVAAAFMAEKNACLPIRELDSQARIDFFSEYERLVLAGSGVDVSMSRRHEIWLRILEIPYRMQLFEDVLPVLEQLKKHGLALGVISNMNLGGATLTKQIGLSSIIDLAVTSAEIGRAKPHPQIFIAALEQAKAKPEEVVHVGDQIRSDIDGAINVGIWPVMLDRDRTHCDFDRCPRIETLSELPALLALY